MNLFLRFVLLYLMADSAFAQSSFPACQGSDVSRWTNCFASNTYSNGTRYEGEYKDGKFHGQGTFTVPNGEKYVGEFKEGKHDGLGTVTFGNGVKYVGEFKLSKYHGRGTMTFRNGEKYVGEWKEDKFGGQGIEYNFSGVIIQQGLWENGVLVQSFAVDPQRFPFDPSLAAVPKAPVADLGTAERDRSSLDLQAAQSKCKELGFKPKTEGYGKCVLQLSK